MTTGSGDKPGAGGAPARAAADTPGRIVVRAQERGASASLLGSDTAVAASSEQAMMDTLAGDSSDTVKPTASELIGTTLAGRYLVTRKVGQGGMGAVYEATHTLIGKRVAVKVLLEKHSQREALVQRLKQEAQLASSIGNEHIIDITDFGNTDDGRTFVVMEFLEGESLAECLARNVRLPEQRILHIASQVASALAAAHAKGVVHRDIKPENIFLQRRKDTDFVKVVDFGISKSLRSTGDEEERVRLTQTGMVLGTPLYMSPEQARGDEELDNRVDIYALGVIMYEAASGRVPFAGANYLSVISQVLTQEPPPLRDLCPELSEEFEAIVSRAIAKDREARYASATVMLDDISALLDDPTHSTERARITRVSRPRPARAGVPRAAWAIGGAGLVAAAVAVAVMLLMGGSRAPVPAAPAASSAQQANATPPDAGGATPGEAKIASAGELTPAPPSEPAVIMVSFKSDPPGAMIYRDDSEALGKAPTAPISVVKQNKTVHIRAQLDGYDDATQTLNPLERKDGETITLKLKPAKGKRQTTKMPPVPRSSTQAPRGTGTGTGSSAPPPVTSKTGGDLSHDPFQSGGTLPPPTK